METNTFIEKLGEFRYVKFEFYNNVYIGHIKGFTYNMDCSEASSILVSPISIGKFFETRHFDVSLIKNLECKNNSNIEFIINCYPINWN